MCLFFCSLLQRPSNIIEYSLVANVLTNTYFQINRETGEISLKRPIGDEPSQQADYVVCVFLKLLLNIALSTEHFLKLTRIRNFLL